MRMFLCILMLIGVGLRAQAETATDVFQREFIARYLETFYRGEPFDFAGLKCEEDPAVEKSTSCVTADGHAVIDVRNIDRRNEGGKALWRGVAIAVTEEPVLPKFDWSVRGRADMDAIMAAIEGWAKPKPATTIGDLCPKPKDYDSRGLKEVRKSIFHVVSPKGERGYLIGVIFSTDVGNIMLFGFMRGEGFCEW